MLPTAIMITVLSITLFILVFLVWYYGKYHESPQYYYTLTETGLSLKKTDAHIINTLYHIMFIVHRILLQNDIPYWTIAGTTLGAIRHKGIIPWDDDIDIGVLDTYEKQLEALEPQLNRFSLSIVKVWFGYKIYYNNIPNLKNKPYSYPMLDIFLFRKTDDRYEFSSSKARRIWPKSYILLNELHPIKEHEFGQDSVFIPNDLSFLTRQYGNWYNEAYREYDHRTHKKVKKIHVRLTDADRKPAMPMQIREEVRSAFN
jgi:lipopolysaccharide cholinephosphotransferase